MHGRKQGDTQTRVWQTKTIAKLSVSTCAGQNAEGGHTKTFQTLAGPSASHGMGGGDTPAGGEQTNKIANQCVQEDGAASVWGEGRQTDPGALRPGLIH